MTARKAVLLLGLTAFIASVLLPPWCAVTSRARVDQGYDFLFSPPMSSSQIDYSRLLLEWAAIGGLSTLGVILTGSRLPKAEGKMPIPRGSTPTPEASTQAKQPSTLTEEQINALSQAVSEIVKSRFVPERHSQAERIVQARVITEAQKHVQATGVLETFPRNQVMEREVSRYASEYLGGEEFAGVPPPIIAPDLQAHLKASDQTTRGMKRLQLISAVLLLASLGLAGLLVRNVDPKNIDVERVASGLTKMIIGCSAWAWVIDRSFGKRRGYGLLTFLLTSAIGILVFCYYFEVGRRHMAQRYGKLADTFQEQAERGGPISVGSTGDRGLDLGVNAIAELSNAMRTQLLQLDDEISQAKEDDFYGVLANRDCTETAIQIRIANAKSIERSHAESRALIDESRRKITELPLSEGFKRGMLRGLDESYQKNKDYLDELFNVRLARESSELELLVFMLNCWGEYKLSDRIINFTVPGRKPEYEQLSANIDAIEARQEALRQRAKEMIERGTQKMRAAGR